MQFGLSKKEKRKNKKETLVSPEQNSYAAFKSKAG